MLKTSQITQIIKRNMVQNGYNYLSNDMKIMLLKEEIKNEICEELQLKNRGEYSIEDMILLLDRNIMVFGINRELFYSYIYAVTNILSDIQGSFISIDQGENMSGDIIKFVNDKYGFVREITINKNYKPATIFIELIHNLDQKVQNKLLVK